MIDLLDNFSRGQTLALTVGVVGILIGVTLSFLQGYKGDKRAWSIIALIMIAIIYGVLQAFQRGS